MQQVIQLFKTPNLDIHAYFIDSNLRVEEATCFTRIKVACIKLFSKLLGLEDPYDKEAVLNKLANAAILHSDELRKEPAAFCSNLKKFQVRLLGEKILGNQASYQSLYTSQAIDVVGAQTDEEATRARRVALFDRLIDSSTHFCQHCQPKLHKANDKEGSDLDYMASLAEIRQNHEKGHSKAHA